MPTDSERIARLLEVLEHDVVPLTVEGVDAGNKIFGAAVLRKSDLSLVIAATNQETDCPLWHGEVEAVRRLWRLPAAERPAPGDCLFLASHEPCSLCLSAITWSGFDNFHYLFGYEDSRDRFAIPHDLRILAQVFDLPEGRYRRRNAYWQAHDLRAEIAALPGDRADPLREKVRRIEAIYADLSARYQAVKPAGQIPLP